MTLYNLLNIVILSLSVATVLITLVAFIIFQIQRMTGDLPKKNRNLKIEGAFFKRYAPHIEKKIKEWENEQNQLQSKKNKKPALSLIASFVTVSVFVTILVAIGQKGFFAREYRSIIVDQEHIDKLLQQGLLQKHEISPMQKEQLLVKKNTASFTNFPFKTNTSILLYSPESPKKKERSNHQIALASWESFLTLNDLSYKKISDLSSLNGNSQQLIIFPQPPRISFDFLEQVSNQLNQGHRVIFTGPIFSKAEHQVSHWTQKWMNIEFLIREAPLTKGFSQISSLSYIPLQMEPGSILSLQGNNQFLALPMKDANVMAFESNFSGKSDKVKGKGKLPITASWNKNQNILWLASDPAPQRVKNDDTIQLYRDSLLFLMGAPSYKKAWWPNGHESVSVVSVDSEDKFENIEDLLDIFGDYQFPVTLFLVSELFEKFHALTLDYPYPLEFASHGNVHDAFAEQKLATQFDRIQNSRHTIELYSSQKLRGFRPPYEKYDLTTLNALINNQLDYAFVDGICRQLYPCELKNGFVLFPRLQLDDYAILKDRRLIEDSAIVTAMNADIAKTQLTGGGYFLSLHTQMFGIKSKLNTVDQLMQKIKKGSKGLFTFAQLTDWYKTRHQIKFEILQNESGDKQLKLSNKNKTPVKNFYFSLFNTSPKSEEGRSLANTRIQCQPKKQHSLCSIKLLRPGETVITHLK